MFDKVLSSVGNFAYRYRKIIALLALVVFVFVAYFQSKATIEYSYAEESVVAEVFPQDDILLIVYSNKDEASIGKLIEYLEQDEKVTSINAYANTLGLEMKPAAVAEMMGIDVSLVNTLYYVHEYGMDAKAITLTEFTEFISSDGFLNNELFASMINEDTKAQISQMSDIVAMLADNEEHTAEEIADLLGADVTMVENVFYIAGFKNSALIDTPATLLATIAQMFGMDSETIEKTFGTTPVKSMKMVDFVDLIYEISGYVQGVIDKEQLAQLEMFKQISDTVKENKKLSPAELAGLFADYTDAATFSESNLALLYILIHAQAQDMSEVGIPLYDLFNFICDDVVTNEDFAPFFDENVAAQLDEAKLTMEDGLAQLVGEQHSRMVITLSYAPDTEEITQFYNNLNGRIGSLFSEKYYLVGATAMSDEVSKSFADEYRTISIVTALAVFAVVLFTFKKLWISLLLIFVIEGAVFSMMSVMTLTGSPMYFIALILVQCILMGSMIDYGILLTTYYIEVRKEYSVKTALPELMKRATHAILMSSLTLIVVTLLCGMFMSGAVATILKTLGIGATCAILLIMFVLPSLLVIFDKFFIESEEPEEEESDPFD